MNAVEIESAISDLASQPFNPKEFPFQFLEAYDNKSTTLDKLRGGSTNKSDVANGVLQRNNIHILVTAPGEVGAGLLLLKSSPATQKHKCQFVLATDGETLEAEYLPSGESVACEYRNFPDFFGFFLPLAGFTTVQSIRESSFDIKAVGRLNRLYLELLRDNPEWKEGELRHEMNRFLVRLVFCFYAEDTNIFTGTQLFSSTLELMSDRSSENTHEVIAEIFRAMTLNDEQRKNATPLPRWAAQFPYVNGGLFSNASNVPRFSRVARSYLIQIGNLNWKEVNPDIFGSMIQGVANDSERSNLGMHYTSVPNILKVLNPLFLDGLRTQLEESRGNPRKLLNLRRRLSRIRVFDPACGSGNFLLVAYKQLRAIEHEINVERREPNLPSEIPLTNFRGIEIQDFAAEVARLSLVIAEFQCNALYLGTSLALSFFLPLTNRNWIVSGNALRLKWEDICPSQGTSVKIVADDLFSKPDEQSEIDFENAGGETYICGNPPYLGADRLDAFQKDDAKLVFHEATKKFKKIDYVGGWFFKAAMYCKNSLDSAAAFVSTNSICQGQQVELLWPLIYSNECDIKFAYDSFRWSNLASKKATVTVVIIGLANKNRQWRKVLFATDSTDNIVEREVTNINAYLSPGPDIIINPKDAPISKSLSVMQRGNQATDDGNLILSWDDLEKLDLEEPYKKLVRPFWGATELINGASKYCFWISDEELSMAMTNPVIRDRIEKTKAYRMAAKDSGSQRLASRSHQMREFNECKRHSVVIPRVTSENRSILPCDILPPQSIVSDRCFVLYDAKLFEFAIIVSRIHWVWIGNVCGKLQTRFNYSNTLGWNTFPLPSLTRKNIEDLTRSAERILEIREHYFPMTIADLYASDRMPEDLRLAHEQNDEIVERIFIGRKFKNDSERLEKLYEMYAALTSKSDKDAKK